MTSDEIQDDEEARHPIVERMFSDCAEVIGREHVEAVFNGAPSHSGDHQVVAYIGLEPSGKAHLGWLLLSGTIRKMLDEGVNVIILLADWHAWVNDKFGRDMEKISLAADYMSEVFSSLLNYPELGNGPGQVRFIRASEVMDSGKYWERVLRCSKNMSLSRVRRTFSIMGRDEDSSDHDLSAFYYPALQAADIFELEVDIAFGGMDQRKAHMYMREAADRNGWIKPTCIHTPMLSGLKGSGGRMDSFEYKMSKSDPNNAIILHDTNDILRKKMKKAYLEVGNDSSAVFEIVEHVIIPRMGEIIITPDPKYGEPSRFSKSSEFISSVSEGLVHPLDAKIAVADALSEILSPVYTHFQKNPELLEKMESLSESK